MNAPLHTMIHHIHHSILVMFSHKEWVSISRRFPCKGSFKFIEGMNKIVKIQMQACPIPKLALSTHTQWLRKEQFLNRIQLGQHIIPDSLLQIFIPQRQTHTDTLIHNFNIYFSKHPRWYISHWNLSSWEQGRSWPGFSAWKHHGHILQRIYNNKISPILIL